MMWFFRHFWIFISYHIFLLNQVEGAIAIPPVVGQRSRSQRQKMMWFFRHFWIFISYHIFLLNQVEGAIAIPPSNSAPLPLFCPSVCPSVCPSIGLLTLIFRFLHICWQVTGKEWHRNRNADVSRWLTLGQHWCRWVLLSFHAFVRLSNHPWAWVCVLHTKRLEEMAYKFGMLMYPDGLHSAFMDAYGYCCWSVCPSICPFVRLRHFQVAVHLLTNHLEQMA